MYIPPNFHLETEHLDTLLKQLPSPYILVGDFNGHNILWGCKDNNPKGNIIEDFITKNDLCLMNDKTHTYLHPATGKFSSLDLSICHPSLLLDFDWTVSEDQHGSDHFPVIIESVNNSTNDHNAKWKLNKANWELYHLLCEESLKIDKFDNSLDPLDDFTSSLLDIANKSIPKTLTNPKKNKPWYNNECKDAIKQRKQALSKFCRYPTKENLKNVKNFRAKARRTIKASKRKSWKSYVSNLNYKTPVKKVWDMIRKISGKSKSPSFTHLNTKRGTKATSKEEIANTLGETFLDNSSSRNYSEKFQNIKKNKKKKSNLISPLQILKNITACLTLQNLKMLSQYQKIQLQALMTSITRCLNTFPKPPLTHFYIFSTVYGQQEFFQKAGVWPQLYLFPNQGKIMQNQQTTDQ